MSTRTKSVESLQVSDLLANPVWEFVNDDTAETALRPVDRRPVDNLDGKLIGLQVRPANGNRVWALVGNVDAGNSRSTQHFLTLSVERVGQWFMLSRYHDLDYTENGPAALSRFLGLTINDVFPISYDIREYASGDPAALAGRILSEPTEKLSQAELIAMAVS